MELWFKFTLGLHGLIIVKFLFLEKRSFVGKIHEFFCFLDSFTILYHFQRYFNFCNNFYVFSENKTNKIEIQSPFLRRKFIFPSATPFQKSKMKYQAKLLLQIVFDWNLQFPRIGNSLQVLYFSNNMQIVLFSVFCLFFQQKKHWILFHC